MRTFSTTAAQGELYFIRLSHKPSGYVEVPPANGRVIVGHSETGHHHVMLAERTKMYEKKDDPFSALLHVGPEGDELLHKRPTDTHETLRFEPGWYEVRRAREYTPEGMRAVQD